MFLRQIAVIVTVVLMAIASRGIYADDSTSPGAAANWPHWRGPLASGVAPNASPPIEWSRDKNIAWVADLPGEGASTPIIWGDRIFLTAAIRTDQKVDTPPDPQSKTLPPGFVYRFEVLCLNRSDGKIIWQRTAIAQAPHDGIHPSHTYASGSPTTDGKQLYVSFGSQGNFCYTLDGELVWQRDLGKMRTRYGWGEATTPVVHDGKLVINWDHEDDSSIYVLNTTDGSTIWQKPRPDEPTSWATPLVVSAGDRELVVVQGTGLVRAYDLKTGDVVWSCGGQSVNAIPSPVQYKDSVICMSGYRQSVVHSIPIAAKGDLTDSKQIRWSSYRGTPYVPSPVISEHRLYFTRTNTGLLSCLNAETGEMLYEPQRLPEVRSMYASPLVAGGHVYFVSRSGTTTVIKDSDQFDVVASNSLDDAIDAAPVAIGNQLFLRSRTKLYCIARKEE